MTIIVTWKAVIDGVDAIASGLIAVRVNGFSRPAAIVTIARGGLPIATALAHRLKLRQIYTVNVASYGDGARSQTQAPKLDPAARQLLASEFIDRSQGYVLVVDDLLHTGDTAALICATLSARGYHPVVAVLFDKRVAGMQGGPLPGGVPVCAARQSSEKEWLQFPWEP